MNSKNTAKETHGYLVDMDGVLYRGKDLIPGGREFIEYMLQENIPFLFLTNNSRPTQRDIVLKLSKIGINVTENHIYTSAMATAQFVARQKPHGSAYCLGEGGLLKALYDNGYAINDVDPDYVIVGEGRTLNLEMVEKAIDMILADAKLIATNMDPSPVIPGWTKPGTRAIVKMLEEATGRSAFSVGKPSPILMRLARKKLGLQTAQTTIIGDTMETDILGGILAGFRTVLVLTGSTQKENLARYPYQPDMVLESIADMIPTLIS